MDNRIIRAARARRIASVLPILVDRGGDELAVLESMLDGFLLGLETHGQLDLDKPRDFAASGDEEMRDWTVYRACKRVADRRARGAAILGMAGDERAAPAAPTPLAAQMLDDLGAELAALQPELRISIGFDDLVDAPPAATDVRIDPSFDGLDSTTSGGWR